MESEEYALREENEVQTDVEAKTDNVEEVQADSAAGTSGRARRPVPAAGRQSESKRRKTLSLEKAWMQRRSLSSAKVGAGGP